MGRKAKIPERRFYKGLPKKFYSPKLKCWVLRSKTYRDGNWYQVDFTNETTGELIDYSASEINEVHASKRALEMVNNERIFG